MILDDQMLLTGSENLNYSSMPADDKSDGTEGNRGVWLITDSPSAIAHALDVFQHDLDPANHKDLFRWTASDPTYGAPTARLHPRLQLGRHDLPGPVPHAPDGQRGLCLRDGPVPREQPAGLGQPAGHGGPGRQRDTVLVEQLYEYKFWGADYQQPDC